MKRIILLWACVLVAPVTFALNNRSAVSLTGSDSNPCTPASPCRSFTAAIAATVPGGEIIALDSGGYGPFAVGSSMTISGAPGVHAAITATSSPGITVNAATTDIVILRNLVLIGAGASYGISVTNAGEVEIFDSLVRGFAAFGIYVNTNAAANILIESVSVFDSTSTGVYLVGDFSGVNKVSATVSNSFLLNNGDGIRSDYGTKTVITHCTIADDSNNGVTVNSSSSTNLGADVTIEGCTIANNFVGTFVGASGTNNTATMTLSQNMLSFNSTAVLVSINGTAYSFGNNRFASNASDGSSLSPATLK